MILGFVGLATGEDSEKANTSRWPNKINLEEIGAQMKGARSSEARWLKCLFSPDMPLNMKWRCMRMRILSAADFRLI